MTGVLRRAVLGLSLSKRRVLCDSEVRRIHKARWKVYEQEGLSCPPEVS